MRFGGTLKVPSSKHHITTWVHIFSYVIMRFGDAGCVVYTIDWLIVHLVCPNPIRTSMLTGTAYVATSSTINGSNAKCRRTNEHFRESRVDMRSDGCDKRKGNIQNSYRHISCHDLASTVQGVRVCLHSHAKQPD